jgi:hypothetical protein
LQPITQISPIDHAALNVGLAFVDCHQERILLAVMPRSITFGRRYVDCRAKPNFEAKLLAKFKVWQRVPINGFDCLTEGRKRNSKPMLNSLNGLDRIPEQSGDRPNLPK